MIKHGKIKNTISCMFAFLLFFIGTSSLTIPDTEAGDTTPDPCIKVIKEGPKSAQPGDTIVYSFTVENCGNIHFKSAARCFDLMFGNDEIWIKDLEPGETAHFELEYEVSLDDCGELTNWVECIGCSKDGDYKVTDEDMWTVSVDCDDEPLGCRFTGGGVDTDGNWDHTLENGEKIRNSSGKLPEGIDRAQFGGQAGAHTALPPQPAGEWTHHQQKGPSGDFTFHCGTSSAPEGSEIIEIRCDDPDGCSPSGNPPSPVKQLDFDCIGTFKNIGKGAKKTPTFEIPDANATAEGHGNKTFDGTFHYAEINIDDLGERGGLNSGAPDPDICPDIGFGEKGATDLANCDCPDFYRITIYDGVDAADVTMDADGNIIQLGLLKSQDVIYEFFGYIDGGNLQIHKLTGFDRK